MEQTTTIASPGPSSSEAHVAGMGPIVLDNGVAFRVWAPNATRVSVMGSFNDWKADAHPLQREESGCWFAIVDNAKPGDEYQYEIQNGEHVFQRIDPRVREVTNSVGNGIVHNPSFDWHGDDFKMPAWNELVIYETHIGTFNRSDDDSVGTFADYMHKFDHLKQLGVNALQLMPLA